MDLLTSRPRHRRPAQPPPQRRRPNSANATTQNKTLPRRPPSSTERKAVPPKKVTETESDIQPNRRIDPQPVPKPHQPPERNSIPLQRKLLVVTKHISTQTEVVLIERKLHDSLLHTVEHTLEVIQKNLQKILDEKSKGIEESYGKLIEDIVNKIDTKKHSKFQENKKVLESKLKEYKNYVKQKHKQEKEKEKERENSTKSERNDNLRLKRQFSLEKLTKLSLGIKHSNHENVETPKLKRQYSFDKIPTKHQEIKLDHVDNPKEDIDELKSRLSKVMGHFKSTEVLNGHDDVQKPGQHSYTEQIHHVVTIPEPIIIQTPKETSAVASFPFEEVNTLSFDAITLEEDVVLEEDTVQEELILPPEDFQEHPYDSKRDQELEYLKSLKGKLSSLVAGHRTSESSSEVSFHEKPDVKKNAGDIKKIKELKGKLTLLLATLKSPEKVDYEKSEKKLLKQKVRYINIRFVQDEEFQNTRMEVIQLFNEAEKIIEAGKHGLKYREESSAPRCSTASDCSSVDIPSSEVSYTESPYMKLEKLKIMLEQMLSDIETAEILNYDLIFNELNKYQEEFGDIRTQLLPEAGTIRQEVFNLLIQAYNLLEDKNSK